MPAWTRGEGSGVGSLDDLQYWGCECRKLNLEKDEVRYMLYKVK